MANIKWITTCAMLLVISFNVHFHSVAALPLPDSELQPTTTGLVSFHLPYNLLNLVPDIPFPYLFLCVKTF